jgi:hypothetical protein
MVGALTGLMTYPIGYMRFPDKKIMNNFFSHKDLYDLPSKNNILYTYYLNACSGLNMAYSRAHFQSADLQYSQVHFVYPSNRISHPSGRIRSYLLLGLWHWPSLRPPPQRPRQSHGPLTHQM